MVGVKSVAQTVNMTIIDGLKLSSQALKQNCAFFKSLHCLQYYRKRMLENTRFFEIKFMDQTFDLTSVKRLQFVFQVLYGVTLFIKKDYWKDKHYAHLIMPFS